MPDDRAALFVRIPTAQARRLDARAGALGRTKQDLVTELLGGWLGPQSRPAERGPEPQRGVLGVLDLEQDQVFTLDELAEFLKLDSESVMERVGSGELPGRLFGQQWRFSRHAVLRWLDGTDASGRPGPGFAGPRSS